MKRLILKAFGLLLFVYALVWTSAQFDNRYFPKDTNVFRPSVAQEQGDLDYLFLGNSYTYSAVHSKKIEAKGFKVFNLGVATAGPIFYDLLLQDYLPNCKNKPKNIVFLLSPTTFSLQADNFEAYPIHRYLTTPVSNLDLLWEQKIPLGTYLLLERNSSKKGFSQLIFGADPTALSLKTLVQEEKGFQPDESTYSPAVYKQTKHFYTDFKKDSFPHDQLENLISLANQLKNENINVQFHTMPTFKLTSFFNANFLKDFDRALDKIDRAGFKVIDYSTTLDSTYFRNIDHMNLKGAELYTDWLIGKLLD